MLFQLTVMYQFPLVVVAELLLHDVSMDVVLLLEGLM